MVESASTSVHRYVPAAPIIGYNIFHGRGDDHVSTLSREAQGHRD